LADALRMEEFHEQIAELRDSTERRVTEHGERLVERLAALLSENNGKIQRALDDVNARLDDAVKRLEHVEDTSIQALQTGLDDAKYQLQHTNERLNAAESRNTSEVARLDRSLDGLRARATLLDEHASALSLVESKLESATAEQSLQKVNLDIRRLESSLAEAQQQQANAEARLDTAENGLERKVGAERMRQLEASLAQTLQQHSAAEARLCAAEEAIRGKAAVDRVRQLEVGSAQHQAASERSRRLETMHSDLQQQLNGVSASVAKTQRTVHDKEQAISCVIRAEGRSRSSGKHVKPRGTHCAVDGATRGENR